MSTASTNEEEQPDHTSLKRKSSAIRDDFPGTAAYIEHNWELLLHDGQQTLIDDNVEELIGWAIHMDGPCSPKNAPSTPHQRVVKLPVGVSEQTITEEEKNKDTMSIASSLNGSHDNGEKIDESRKSGDAMPATTEKDPSNATQNEQGTKKRKRPRKPNASSNNITYLDFSPSPSNMLRSLPNIPIRPSVLQYLHDCFVETIEKENASNDEAQQNNNVCWEVFDTSALVALGIIVEEMLTAALIPLAEMHVYRCRHIRDQQASSEEWTLPPTEAIMKLMASRSPSFVNPLGSFPTTRMPSRISKVVTDQDSCQQAIPAWLRKHKTDLGEVHKLWHLFKYFLPSHLEPTTVTRYKTKKRARIPNKAVTTKESNKTPENAELLLKEDPNIVAYAEV